MLERIKNYRIPPWGAWGMIFGVCALAFGPLMTQLGFYWDDWPVIQVIHLRANLWEFYAYNRPASAWTQAFFAPLLGTSPLNWHLFAEGVWALTAMACWWMLDLLWPERKRETAAMALLLAVHPIFLLHPIAVAFSQQYLTFLPFFLSMGAMLAAVRNPRRFWLWTAAGLLTALIHLVTMEYFWGLELVRPVLLWMVLGKQEPAWRAKLGSVLKVWGPYLIALGGVVVWRMFFVTLLEDDPNALALVIKLVHDPVGGLVQLVQGVVNDFTYMMFLRWGETLKLEWLNFQDRFSLFAWSIAGVAGVAIGGFFRRWGDETRQGQKPVLGLGFLVFLAGGLAVWLPGRSVTVGLYADRFALPALLGVVMLTVGGVGVIVRPRWQPVVWAVLFGLAISMQLRVQNDYRWDWVNQQRAFWQLYWRAPALAEHTTVFSDGTLFRYTGGYPTASALNVLYPQSGTGNEMDYWFLELDRGYIQLLTEMTDTDYPIQADFREFTFNSTSSQSLVVTYAPEAGDCLWVLRESDLFNPDLSALLTEAVPLSNLDQIRVDIPGTQPDTAVFGAEPAHTWCYFYQKAELARQQEDWAGILALAKKSTAQGLSPNNRLEWLPYVEAYAHTGDWERALDLSVDALNYSKTTRNLFCPIWRGFEQEGLDAPAGTFAKTYEQLGCKNNQGR